MNNSVPPLPQPTPTPSPVPPRRKIFTSHFLELIGLFVVIALVAYLGIQYWQDKQLSDEYVPVYTPRVVKETGDQNLKTFSSKDLGVSFTYLADQDHDGKADIQVQEIGDKVYVSPFAVVASGQSVEVWKKDAKLTLAQAVTQQILKNYAAKDCFAVSYDVSSRYGSNFVGAEISYPNATTDLGTVQQYFQKCPTAYAKTNGLRYFLMDKNNPTEFAFFNIGQYPILGDNNNHDWPTTFTFGASDSIQSMHCGGNMQNAPMCPSGYHCAAAAGSTLPVGDVGGTCQKN